MSTAKDTGRAWPPAVTCQRLRARVTNAGMLAMAAKMGSTPRHLSFLETARSRPGQQEVTLDELRIELIYP
ncbi:MAG TPA: hypothetical protein VFA46_21040 [Actinomycetes bacterium]|jgi:hypothetical protein|nr:hypothetical protein [Actinomycetes bacterium]